MIKEKGVPEEERLFLFIDDVSHWKCQRTPESFNFGLVDMWNEQVSICKQEARQKFIKNSFFMKIMLVCLLVTISPTINYQLDSTVDSFEFIQDFSKLPKEVKKSFRRYNCSTWNPFTIIFYEIKYEFKIAALSEQKCMVHYLHTGRTKHHHISIFYYDRKRVEVNTYDVEKEIKSFDELLFEVRCIENEKSECVFKLVD